MRRRALLAGCAAVVALALSLPASATAAPVPLGAPIGSLGAGAGQLDYPSAVAIDGAGNLYVTDTNNDRISEFAADGTFIRAFGWGVDTGAAAFEVCTTASTCQTGLPGGGAGQLTGPYGIAVDGTNNLYVADNGNNRISVFNTAGPSFTHSFGRNVIPGGTAGFEVCTAGTTCQPGEASSGNGELSGPSGLAFDGAGNLYVSEFSNNRVSVFNTAAPSFSYMFGWDVISGPPSGLYEVCTSANICTIGSAGPAAGQLSRADDVALDGAGGVYVADQNNERISVFNAAGPSFRHAFGWGVDTGAAAFEVCTTASTCQTGLPGGGAGQFSGPYGIAADGAGGLYAADGSNHRISAFGTAGPSFNHSFGWDVIPGMPTGLFEVCTTGTTCGPGSFGGGVGQLNDPEDVASDCRGAAWVADSLNNRVQRLGEPGTPLPPCPAAAVVPPVVTPPAAAPTTGLTGRRAAALRKCKKKFPKGSTARKKCIRKAKKLPA